jgi:hypothetical protein
MITDVNPYLIKDSLNKKKNSSHEEQWVHLLCNVTASFFRHLPQVSKTNPPRLMDVAGEGLLYD